MSHPQMENGVKYQMFEPRKWYFGHLLVTCTEFALSLFGKFIGNFLVNKQFLEVSYQMREAKQQFSENSKWKHLTPSNVDNHLIPYNFNSKGDYLRQAEFWIVFEAVCLGFLIK